MIRFIFVCMAVTTVSLLSLAGMYMFDGINAYQDALAERNLDTVPEADVAVIAPPMDEMELTPEFLNSIETAAGADAGVDEGFGASFTNAAPKALAEDTPESAIAPAAGDADAQPAAN